jgi:folate-binding protein YgfZ
MTSRLFLELEDRGILTIGGADRQKFLQGLISNDIGKASTAHAIYSSLLTPQGRYLHDFFIAEFGDAFYVDAEAARLDDLRRRLTLYRLRSQVTLAAVSDQFAVVALFGKGAVESLRLTPEPGRAIGFAGGVAFVDPRLAAVGARAIVPRANLQEIAAAGFAAGSRADYERLRLSLGIPDGSRDLPVEKALLLENGFDELHGIDWKKGCYVGQEVTARMKYRSLVKKQLMPVRIEGATPAPGTPVVLDGEEAGEMRTALDAQGLALLRLDVVERADREGRRLTAGDAAIMPFKPAWAHS